MNIPFVHKYGFRIRTRNGALVDNLLIAGRDAADAEGRLRRMYRDCEVLERRLVSTPPGRVASISYEDVVDLIASR